LIAKGADVNALDKHLKSPLYLTVNSEHRTQNDCVRVLLEGGAETNPVLHNSGVVRSTLQLCSANEADRSLKMRWRIFDQKVLAPSWRNNLAIFTSGTYSGLLFAAALILPLDTPVFADLIRVSV
jgi:hypothetical protein